ncbi:MAG: hypothetical protein HOV81_28405 [Kofleriaceae bacterium]|nr:hypothetical protein [Kofleriaceae bacterium]
MIRNAREIGGHVYACGMKRQVYKRSGEKKWVAINAPAAGATEKFGFEAIHGFSDKEIYAAGWGGEIWQYDGKRWTSRTSGVEHTLTAVCCAGDDEVYVAGVHGTLLRGRNDTWQSIPTTTTADLWDLCWFQDRLYVATMTGLFVLDGKKLVPVKFGKEKPATCYSLSTSEGVLWSVGLGDVASFDGKKWQTY